MQKEAKEMLGSPLSTLDKYLLEVISVIDEKVEINLKAFPNKIKQAYSEFEDKVNQYIRIHDLKI